MILSIMHWAKLAFILSAAVASALTCSAAQTRNISGRAGVGTGDNVLITGFTLSSGSSAIIVRALGPSLSAYGIAAPLMDPVLEVHDSTGAVIATNDNWRDTQQQEFGPGGIYAAFRPGNESEPAIAITLRPGAYTAVVRGKNGTTRIALAEVYIATGNSVENVSSRALVGTGDDALIGGLITTGDTGQFVVRALGPSLAQFGVTNPLPNPRVELYDSNGQLIQSNDDWMDDQQQANQIEAKGLALSNRLDSALAVTLTPGNYTAVVKGGNTSGVALLEVYGPVSTAKTTPAVLWGHCTVNALTSSSDLQREMQDMWDNGGRCPRIDGDAKQWGWLDTAVNAAHSVGFTQMVLIYYGNLSYTTLPDTTTFANGAVALARAYPDAMIELSNEPNLHAVSAQQYAALAKAAYRAIKDAGLPNIILLGGVGNSNSVVGNLSMLDWCKQLVANGCVQGQAFDWANYHLYDNPSTQEPYFHIWTPDANGDSCQSVFGNPPFAVTEFGEACSWIGGDEAKQAAYISGWMQAFKAQPQFRLGCQFALADDFTGNGNGFGLRRLDLSHRPSWDAYKAQVDTWGTGANQNFTLQIKTPGPASTAIWYLNNNAFVARTCAPTLPVGWIVVGVADFNGDSQPDYLLYNVSTRQTAVWYLNNNVFVSGAYGPTLPAGWKVVGVADFDGDGRPDYLLFCQPPNGNLVFVWNDLCSRRLRPESS